MATELIRTGRAAHAVLGADISTSFPAAGAQIVPARASGTRSVTPGGPAAQAGLRPGDVISRFAGQQITSATALLDAVRSREPGARVTVAFRRNGPPDRDAHAGLGGVVTGMLRGWAGTRAGLVPVPRPVVPGQAARAGSCLAA